LATGLLKEIAGGSRNDTVNPAAQDQTAPSPRLLGRGSSLIQANMGSALVGDARLPPPAGGDRC